MDFTPVSFTILLWILPLLEAGDHVGVGELGFWVFFPLGGEDGINDVDISSINCVVITKFKKLHHFGSRWSENEKSRLEEFWFTWLWYCHKLSINVKQMIDVLNHHAVSIQVNQPRKLFK